MKWTVTSPPATEPISVSEAQTHARTDSDSDDFSRAEQAIRTVRSTAETEGQISLITQTITAVVYSSNELERVHCAALLRLPRGPVTSIASITDGNSTTVSASDYELQRYGLHDYVHLKKAPKFPLTIVYIAGYGATAADIPPILKGIMLAHFTFLYENRSADVDPSALDRIYRKYRSFAG